MKINELKTNLMHPNSVYFINGDDRFICFQALNIIKEICPNMPELNTVYKEGVNLNINELLSDLQVYPFGDPYRLIIVKDYKYKKGQILAKELAVLNDYSNQTEFGVVLVFFNAGEKQPSFLDNGVVVECNKMQDYELEKWVLNKLKNTQVTFSKSAMQKLIIFSQNDLTKINNEVEKLIAYKLKGEVTEQDIESLVSRTLEYQVFELAETIAKGNNPKAIEIVNEIYIKEKSAFALIYPLYNNYRRALFISINKNLSDKELATCLQIKEYAVKMLRAQTNVFSAKKLKLIVDNLASLDANIKQGKIKDDIGLISSVINILMIKDI